MRVFETVSFLALSAVAFGLLAGAGPAAAQTGFTTWPAALAPGATVNVSGLSQEFTYTSGFTGMAVSSAETVLDGSITETLDANGQVASVSLRSGGRSVGFIKGNGDTINTAAGGRAIYARASDWTRQALVFDAAAMGWTYQTFGVWQSGVGQAAGSFGGVSVGAATSGASTPQVGVADFAGAVGGVYLDATGQSHVISGDMGMNVNFAAHTAEFWTSGMQDSAGLIYNDLAMSGSYVGLPNHPKLYGTLSTARLTGPSTAQFYGPTAEEIGGVFGLAPKSGNGLERFAGAFGGKRTSAGARLPARVSASAPASASAFTSWLALSRGAMEMTGISQEMYFRPNGGGGTQIDPPSEVAGATYSFTIGNQGVERFAMATPSQSIEFSQAAGDGFGSLRADSRVLIAVNDDTVALSVDTDETGWNYQTFGAWMSFTGEGSGNLGAVSTGAATPGAAIPTTGAATFAGMVGGAYIDQAGSTSMVAADMTLAVDFVARTANFASGNMTDVLYRDVYNGTALSGALTYAAKTNSLTGTLTTANGRLSGKATGQFYGPTAQEVGGTFILTPTGAGIERLAGAFGAKR